MKVAICTPVHGDPKLLFTRNLADLVTAATKAGLDVQWFAQQSSIVTISRIRLAEAALAWGADHLLWIDADQAFPPDALDRLLAHHEPIVGCNYARKTDPSGPTALALGATDETQLVWTTLEKAQHGEIEEVDALGLGMCLVVAEVFRAVEKPWFNMEFDAEGRLMGEDYWFCLKARAAGFRILVDHGLSWSIGHLGEMAFTNMHASLDRARFEMANRRPQSGDRT